MTAGEDKERLLRHVPTDKPPFTVSQLKKAIPPHCFNRSALRSASYLAFDLTLVSALLYLALHQIPRLASPFNFIAWPLYWVLQGCSMFTVWVIAHECGHNAFSNSQLLDDALGLVLHSALLSPYFSWKISHRRHHSNTASLERDEVFVPKLKPSLPWYNRYLTTPPGRFICLFSSLTIGWPMYLTFNIAGRSYPRWASHFDPYSPIFSDRERSKIFVTDASFLVVSYALYRLAVSFSLAWVIKIYGAPIMIMNAWLILVTYLHHTHPALPHYDSTEWDWLRGALATVDRDYGAVLNKMFHNIHDTHVLHHLFSMIPHYHAVEATEAIKPVLGEYYRYDATPLHTAMWREALHCVYVEPEAGKGPGVYWYNNKVK